MNKSDIKILLVDDEPDILEIVGYNLKNEGYQIYKAANGLEALKSAKKKHPSFNFIGHNDARNGRY
jgi:two-component system alkaline phosphatase synthesis response regulator PhoP